MKSAPGAGGYQRKCCILQNPVKIRFFIVISGAGMPLLLIVH